MTKRCKTMKLSGERKVPAGETEDLFWLFEGGETS